MPRHNPNDPDLKRWMTLDLSQSGIGSRGWAAGRLGHRHIRLPAQRRARSGTRCWSSVQAEDTAGTVGGGLIEARMIERAGALLAEPTSQIHRFDLGQTPDDEKGICGGSVEFLIETFDKTALPLFRDLSAGRDRTTDACWSRSSPLIDRRSRPS